MSLTFEEIILTVYSEQFKLGQFTLSNHGDGNGVVISSWNVPDIKQPTNDEIIAMYSENIERLHTIYALQNALISPIQNRIDMVSQQKDYGSGLICCSYSTSLNEQWKSEALAFIEWRDKVWTYAYNLLDALKTHQDDIPSIEYVLEGIPEIKWPD